MLYLLNSYYLQNAIFIRRYIVNIYSFFLPPIGQLSPMTVRISKYVMDVNVCQNTEALQPVFRARERPDLPRPEGNWGEFISPRFCISVSSADLKPHRGCHSSMQPVVTSSLFQALTRRRTGPAPAPAGVALAQHLAPLHGNRTCSSSPGLFSASVWIGLKK